VAHRPDYLLTALLGFLLTASCVSQRHGLLSKWDEDDPTTRAATRVRTEPNIRKIAPVAPEATAVITPAIIEEEFPAVAQAVIDPEQLAADLEIALLHFTSELKMLSTRVLKQKRRSKKKTKKWPKVIQLLWSKVLDELQAGLAIPDDDLMPKRVLLQAHVTTAAEKEITERRFGHCPEALSWRVKDLHQQIHRLLQRNAVASGKVPRTPLTVGKSPKMQWPVSPQIYTSFFGLRRDPINGARKFHTGIDMGADRGTVVSAAARGRVIHSSWAGGYGRMVVVQHIGGYQTVYAHLGKILAPIGSKVDGGTPLGLVGSSGRSTGPHLHFELRYGGRPIDPMKLMRTHYTYQNDRRTDASDYLSAVKTPAHHRP
jgi:murein DD-endopeptidase MepM/ murein hydrolase activator NlpD